MKQFAEVDRHARPPAPIEHHDKRATRLIWIGSHDNLRITRPALLGIVAKDVTGTILVTPHEGSTADNGVVGNHGGLPVAKVENWIPASNVVSHDLHVAVQHLL